jgi:hypothetical protein
VTAGCDSADPVPQKTSGITGVVAQEVLARAQQNLTAAEKILWDDLAVFGPADADLVLDATCQILGLVTALVLWQAGPGANGDDVSRAIRVTSISRHLETSLSLLRNVPKRA